METFYDTEYICTWFLTVAEMNMSMLVFLVKTPYGPTYKRFGEHKASISSVYFLETYKSTRPNRNIFTAVRTSCLKRGNNFTTCRFIALIQQC